MCKNIKEVVLIIIALKVSQVSFHCIQSLLIVYFFIYIAKRVNSIALHQVYFHIKEFFPRIAENKHIYYSFMFVNIISNYFLSIHAFSIFKLKHLTSMKTYFVSICTEMKIKPKVWSLQAVVCIISKHLAFYWAFKIKDSFFRKTWYWEDNVSLIKNK